MSHKSYNRTTELFYTYIVMKYMFLLLLLYNSPNTTNYSFMNTFIAYYKTVIRSWFAFRAGSHFPQKLLILVALLGHL